MGKTFYKGIINPVLVLYYTLATKTMPRAISFGTGAIGVNIFTNRALNAVFVHHRTPFERCLIQSYHELQKLQMIKLENEADFGIWGLKPQPNKVEKNSLMW